jgi:hypothetical protein
MSADEPAHLLICVESHFQCQARINIEICEGKRGGDFASLLAGARALTQINPGTERSGLVVLPGLSPENRGSFATVFRRCRRRDDGGHEVDASNTLRRRLRMAGPPLRCGCTRRLSFSAREMAIDLSQSAQRLI